VDGVIPLEIKNALKKIWRRKVSAHRMFLFIYGKV